MLDILYIREHADEVRENIKNRHSAADLDALLKSDEERRILLAEMEKARARLNKASKLGPPKTEQEKDDLKSLKSVIQSLEKKLTAAEGEYREQLMSIPNRTHQDVPIGSEHDFVVLETAGEPPSFDFTPKTHEELMTGLDLIDFERGAGVAGSKFYFVKNELVRLNSALLQYGMNVAEKHGYTLVETPDVAKREIVDASGFNPRGAESQMYRIEGHDLSLIATAEIAMLGYHAGEILDLEQGPRKYAALSHCFRTEAGSYGRTVKGLYRVHQFTKLELFVFCKPEDSDRLHHEVLALEKEICDGLGLSYRVIDVASGDLGAPAYRKYDIEAWMTMKNEYGEITSASNCTDYQARRLNIKYRDKDGKKDFLHTLNGTAVVLSRFPLAIAEQFQNADGSITVPDALRPYMGIDKIT